MLRAFGQVEAEGRVASSRRGERHAPGELRRTSLRASPRRAFTSSLLLFGMELLLCAGAIPALWYLPQSSLPTSEVTAPQAASAREIQPDEQVAKRHLPPSEAPPQPEGIAPAEALGAPELTATAARSSETLVEAGPPDPSSTGSIPMTPREADQTQALRPASAGEEVPEQQALQQLPPRPAAPNDHESLTGGDLVNLNTAASGTLDGLGIGLVGRRVVGSRPYARPEDLLTKRVLTRKDFELIRSKVTAR